MRLDLACNPTFARHETFHPRFGWFLKAFTAAACDPAVFYDDNATVSLGVGKNMVRSIRFWGTAGHLLVDEPVAGSRQRNTKPTNVAVALLHPRGGLDPYMEDIATWWWLHWLLVGPACDLPVWWTILHELSVVEVDEDLLLRACQQVIATSTWDAPHESSIAKDIAAFVRTYGNPSSRHTKFDDQFGCPLRDLGLLAPSPPSGQRLANSRPTSLPGAIVLMAILDFIASQPDSPNTVNLARLAAEPGSPARAFRLDDASLFDLVAPFADVVDGLTLTAPAGSPQLGWRTSPHDIAESVIVDHYGYTGDELPPLIGTEARAAFPDHMLLQLAMAQRKNAEVS